MRSYWSGVFLFLVTILPPVSAGATPVFDFEGFSDSTIFTNQYPGLTFSHAIVLTAGLSLNELDFPPHSGVNVISDNGGPMSILFSTPVTSVGGYFTYVTPLVLDAFDTTNTQVATASSLFSVNDVGGGVPGSSPNEFIQLTFAGGISMLTINGDPAGGSFTLDDLTLPSATTAAPEPASLALLAAPLIGLVIGRRRRVIR